MFLISSLKQLFKCEALVFPLLLTMKMSEFSKANEQIQRENFGKYHIIHS